MPASDFSSRPFVFRSPARRGAFALPTAAVLFAALFTVAPRTGLVFPVSTARAAPEPEPVPRRWELSIIPGDLRVTSVELPGQGPRAFFYFTYSVTNTSGEDRNFAPSFELATDRGEVLRSGRGVPHQAVEGIRMRLKDPEIRDEITIQGMLLQGPENAREGVVVWPAMDLKADEYTIFAAGFSGETKAVARPDTGETVILRKTLMLRHSAPGQLDPNSGQSVERVATRWILR